MEKHPNAKIRVLILWSPIRPGDSRWTARDAAHYLSDSRSIHFWDLWQFGARSYTKKLNYAPGESAWDIYVGYKEGLTWGPEIPESTFWMQNHGLDIGPKYSPDLLEQELEKYIDQNQEGSLIDSN